MVFVSVSSVVVAVAAAVDTMGEAGRIAGAMFLYRYSTAAKGYRTKPPNPRGLVPTTPLCPDTNTFTIRTWSMAIYSPRNLFQHMYMRCNKLVIISWLLRGWW